MGMVRAAPQSEGLCLAVPRNDGPIFGQEIGVGSLWEFLGHGKPSIALVQVSRALEVLVVPAEGTVISAARTVGRGRTVSFLEAVAAGQFPDPGFRVVRIFIAIESIDWEAVHGVADEGRMFLRAHPQLLQEPGRQAVVMVGSVGLNVGVVFINPQRHGSAQGLVVPAPPTVAQKELRCAGVEKYPIDGYAERRIGGPTAGIVMERNGLLGGLRFDRDREGISLLSDGMGIPTVWKPAYLVLGNPVGGNIKLSPVLLEALPALEPECLGRGDRAPGFFLGDRVLPHGRGTRPLTLGVELA